MTIKQMVKTNGVTM